MTLTSETYKSFILALAELFEEQKDNLCELDRKIGDGDHGVTMNIGYQAVKSTIHNELQVQDDIAKISVAVGKSFLDAVGSSVGPLYASGFLKSAVAVKNKTELDDTDLYQFWIAFSKGIKARGKTEIGDKTMIDTLEPFYLSLETSKSQTINFKEAFEIALLEAKKGMESTKDIVSNKGRSKRLGYRSQGHVDPGAMSAYLMLNTFKSYV
ncbi:dihydroxyacetone kinase subunit DhaL [Staphylococcus cohnii species complex 1658]|uniref:dihydroxyacetone kinase subunit DhaL n=1 Tax=Staphylococcus TaxID=1279 RepID=UPI00085C75DE|nr:MULTISPECIES: dihydroxyacetone kinase subunit DhaL [Staphylococcus]PTG49477.1 dihydroxyacetone kinase subunit L [Staphylococcus cohnii]SCS34874.1 dihydroxyacetone kinase [Staphylococcus cohnii subsp. cohnii]MDQ7111170.1 dihydroxyacetone kinase subunit DhaL [Staphylococcus ureilyticus]MDU9348084.1 dihydroxyacetone kinase subunit DhaL [Staphylococcus ureilyticus]QQV53484.1 dihydroxyacetone kinase subunit L [Staphylococcus sp. 11-B-312]